MHKKKFIFLLLLPTIFLSYCSSDKNPISDEEPSPKAKYELTFRGARQEWNPQETSFSMHAAKTGEVGIYTWVLRMQWSKAPSDYPGYAAFTFYDNRPIHNIDAAFSSSLVHLHTFAEEMECLDNPGGCINVGYALVGGTEPKGSLNDLPTGVNNDIHATSGTITVTKIKITRDDGYTIEGYASGHFNISGINTNASKPNPGTASGKFENAPFSTLAIR